MHFRRQILSERLDTGFADGRAPKGNLGERSRIAQSLLKRLDVAEMPKQCLGDIFGYVGDATEHADMAASFVSIPFSFGEHEPGSAGWQPSTKVRHLVDESFQQNYRLVVIVAAIDRAESPHGSVD